MRTINLVLWVYFALYVAIALMVLAIAADQGCLINCPNASFGGEDPYGNPITWIVILFLFWPIPLMIKRLATFAARIMKR